MAQRPTIAQINRGAGVALEIGCGESRARPGFVTIDMRDLPSVDLVGDARTILSQLADNTVTAIHTSHFLEHVDDVTGFVAELVRVSRTGATWEVIVPHFSNPWYYSDVTHKGFFGLYSFSYLAHDKVGYTRQVPGYVRLPGLELVRVKLTFASLRQWPVRHFLRKAWQILVNLSPWTQEFYEDCFTGIVPCYQLTYHLKVAKDPQ